MTARVAWTYQDYAALPEDGKRYEIHDGELFAALLPYVTRALMPRRLRGM